MALADDEYWSAGSGARCEPGNGLRVEADTSVRRGGAWDPTDVVRAVKRDLPGAAGELLQYVRSGAERERIRRADVVLADLDAFLDEEPPDRRWCRRLADYGAKGTYDTTVANGGDQSCGEANQDSPLGACGSGGARDDPPRVAVGSAWEQHSQPIAAAAVGGLRDHGKHGLLAGDRSHLAYQCDWGGARVWARAGQGRATYQRKRLGCQDPVGPGGR